MKDTLAKYILKKVKINDADLQLVLSYFKPRSVKKKEILLHEGSLSNKMYFVVKGCLRSYSIDHNGFEHILQFAPPGWWIGDMQSFNTQAPGVLNIDAVDKSEVLLIKKNEVDKLYR